MRLLPHGLGAARADVNLFMHMGFGVTQSRRFEPGCIGSGTVPDLGGGGQCCLRFSFGDTDRVFTLVVSHDLSSAGQAEKLLQLEGLICLGRVVCADAVFVGNRHGFCVAHRVFEGIEP